MTYDCDMLLQNNKMWCCCRYTVSELFYNSLEKEENFVKAEMELFRRNGIDKFGKR